ncbi:MAG: putative enzyme related to lactoylglutathione lyase [Roseivirga sp.]|jgi:predicted enzyme related to lactoylglutathione lyase
MDNMISKSLKKMSKPILNWFEIPVLDLQRAVAFFNHLYSVQLEIIGTTEYAMAILPTQTGVGGALVMGQGCIPSETGILIYLNALDDMDAMLERIEHVGGRVIMRKTKINDDSGYFSLFIDSEGNKLALHSNV